MIAALFDCCIHLLVEHHARCKHSKQDCLHQESQHCQQLRRLIEASHAMFTVSVVPVAVTAGGESRNYQHERKDTAEKRVKDKENEELVVPNTDAVVYPGTL